VSFCIGNITCGHNTWRCISSGECVPHSFRCDSINDCKSYFSNEVLCKATDLHFCHFKGVDGSDEVGCAAKTPQCDSPSRLCDNKRVCVGVSKLCDGIKDCVTGEDEGSKDTSLCRKFKITEHPFFKGFILSFVLFLFVDEKQCTTNQSNCSDGCQNSPEGHVCYCPQGKHLSTNKSLCVDDHPCDQWGTCSQICRRIGSRHHCLCLSGYDLKDDGFTCTSSNPEIPYLVFSNRHELRGINLRNLQFNSLISNLRNSIALDFYYNTAKNSSVVYWTDVVDDRIYKGNLITGCNY